MAAALEEKMVWSANHSIWGRAAVGWCAGEPGTIYIHADDNMHCNPKYDIYDIWYIYDIYTIYIHTDDNMHGNPKYAPYVNNLTRAMSILLHKKMRCLSAKKSMSRFHLSIQSRCRLSFQTQLYVLIVHTKIIVNKV